jgi:TolB-like protein
MSAIVPGYEYDIFISYRQKDNKYDGWVTEFVNNLKKELDATFKEEISIYYDENPHDGLLDTYIVEKSLEGKLKSIIFIPIISRTYCDPKSFAWQHEFVAFNKLAINDRFGRDMKLASGNVASRILPVKIYDLDPEDKILLENEFGGILPAVEFVYKSPGVNRPLKPDDSRSENLNHTFYRDQINKVANSVKEITYGLKNFEAQKEEILTTKSTAPTIHPMVRTKPMILNRALWVVIITVFLVSGYIALSSLFKTSTIPVDKSIAVLPFENLSNNPENEYFSKGVLGAINRYLSQISELRVISLTSTDLYKNSSKSSKEISKELSVSNLLKGSIQRSGNKIRIEVQLIDAANEHQLWAGNYDREIDDIFKIQSEIAENVALAMKATLSPEEKAVLNQKMTSNTKANDLYMKGNFAIMSFTRNGIYRAMEYFNQAIEQDPNFALAYSGLASCYIDKAAIFGAELNALDAFALASPYLKKALELDPDLPEARTLNGFYLLYNNWDFKGAEQEYKKSIITNYNAALHVYSDFLNFVNRDSDALIIAERLNQTDPFFPISNMVYALYYLGRYEEATEFAKSRLKLFYNFSTLGEYGFLMLNTNYYTEAIESFQKAMELEGIRYPRILGWMGSAYARSGQQKKAMEIIEELKELSKTTRAGSVGFFIAVIYAALGDKDSALHWIQEAYTHHEMEIPWLKSEPQFYSLHDDPEFQEIVRKVGFP